MKVAEPDAAALLRALVEIPSVNPRDRSPDRAAGEGESDVAAFVRQWLDDRGLTATSHDVLQGRPNVLAVLPGRDPRAILLESHLDTVEAPVPQPVRVRDGRLYGRGACDAKGSLAAFMLALAMLAERRPARTVVLAAVCDEEHAYRGVTRLLDDLAGREIPGAIVGEPTGLLPVTAHKGVLRYTVRAIGRAAHSSRPADGVNAISLIVPVLERLAVAPHGVASHPLLGQATRSATRLRGGTGPNTIPDLAEVDVDRRTRPGEDPMAVWDHERADPLDCHAYLIRGSERSALIDAGAGRSATESLRNLRGAEPDRLLLTHGHADHAGGAAALTALMPGLRVLAGSSAHAWIATGDEARLSVDRGRAAGVYPPGYAFPACQGTEAIVDGTEIDLGAVVLRAITTPGQADGHTCYLLRAAGYQVLFSGDCVFTGGRVSLQNIHDCRIPELARAALHLSAAHATMACGLLPESTV